MDAKIYPVKLGDEADFYKNCDWGHYEYLANTFEDAIADIFIEALWYANNCNMKLSAITYYDRPIPSNVSVYAEIEFIIFRLTSCRNYEILINKLLGFLVSYCKAKDIDIHFILSHKLMKLNIANKKFDYLNGHKINEAKEKQEKEQQLLDMVTSHSKKYYASGSYVPTKEELNVLLYNDLGTESLSCSDVFSYSLRRKFFCELVRKTNQSGG